MKTSKLFAPTIVFLSVLIGCSSNNEDTLATVDKHKISKTSFEAYQNLSIHSAEAETTDQDPVTTYVDSEALAIAIEKTGALDTTAIDAQLREMRKELIKEQYFEKFLAEHLTDENIKKYHASEDNQFTKPSIQVAHILLSTHQSMNNEERKAKYERAYEAYQKVKTGTDFGSVAAQYSEDPLTSDKGGVLGPISQGDIHPQFSKVVFQELEAGEVSKPFQTQFGYHVVTRVGHLEDKPIPLNKAKNGITHFLSKKLKKEEMERLMDSVEITIY